MSTNLIIIVVVVVVAFTLSYKLVPYRQLSGKKPTLALFPKYQTEVNWASSDLTLTEIEQKLADFGFKKSKMENEVTLFQRGHLLGDFSVKLMKVKCGVSAPKRGKSTITLEAGWMAAFDTGDFWTFLTELKQKLERT
jgi:hypothetical protein